jgi:hypothetical protein
MRRILFLLLAGLCAASAQDAWTKVSKLKSGVEIRIFKRGSLQPLLAKMGEATADQLVIIVKNEQMAVAKEDIDRLDYRPDLPGGRLVKETSTTPSTVYDPNTNKTTSGVVVRGKPEFETIYRRPPPPKK